MISINGAIVDAIERYKYSFQWGEEIPNKTSMVTYYFDDISIADLRLVLNDETAIKHEIINNYNNYSECTNSELQVIYNLSEEDKKAELRDCINYRKSSINFIQKYIDRSEDNKKEVANYLKHIKMHIEGLKF